MTGRRDPETGSELASIKVTFGPDADADARDALLLQRAAAGDSGAFRTLTGRYLWKMVAIARRMLGDDADAEDVAQEAFLRLWRSAGAIEVGDAGVRPWLTRVVANLCIDRTRSRKRITVTDELPEVADEPRQLRGLEDEELGRRVRAAMLRLPERQRLALTLFHYEDMSQIEVGAAMGISDEAVESLLARARRQLKNDLRPEWQSLLSDT